MKEGEWGIAEGLKRGPGGRFLWQIMHPNLVLSTSTAKKPVNLYTVHDGAVHTVQRSPFFNDIILTVGGWNVAIWKEEVLVSCLQNRAGGCVFATEKDSRNTGCSGLL